MTDTYRRPALVLGDAGRTGRRVVERLARGGLPTRVAGTVALPVDAVPEPFVDATGRLVAFESLTVSGWARDTAATVVGAPRTVASR